MPIWYKDEDQRNEEHASSYINGPKSTGRPLFFHLDSRQLSSPNQQRGEVSPHADFPILPKGLIELLHYLLFWLMQLNIYPLKHVIHLLTSIHKYEQVRQQLLELDDEYFESHRRRY